MLRNRSGRLLTLLAALVLVAAACGGDSSSGSDRMVRVEEGLVSAATGEQISLTEMMDSRLVPGVSVAVVNDFEIEWAKGYGLAETDTERLVTAETLFQTGSIGKPITAAAVLYFVDEGLLDLDTDISEYLTSWRPPESGYTTTEKVTLRRLLSHTAGITVGGFVGYPPDDPLPTLPQILDGEFPANSPAVRSYAVPGSGWQYSGGGYVIIQQLLEDMTGKSFSQVLEETVFEPLGMTSTFYAAPLPDDFHSQAASAHNRAGRVGPTGKWHDLPEFGSGAGLWSTPSDLARFVIEIMRAYRGESDLILSQPTAELMLRPVVTFPDSEVHQGLGFVVSGTGDNLVVAHSGGNEPGYQAVLIAIPGSGQGVAIMTNSASGSMAYNDILASIISEYQWPHGPLLDNS